MPKSNAQMARESVARKRKRARESGLSTLLQTKAQTRRIVCISCNAAALERKKRLRQKNREVRISRQLIAADERAGDIARGNISMWPRLSIPNALSMTGKL